MKSILLHVHGDAGQAARVAAAIAIAKATSGRIKCLQVTPMSSYVVAEPFGGMFMVSSLYEALEKQNAKDRETVEAQLKVTGASADWEGFDGGVAQSIVSQSRLVDIIILSQADYERRQGLHPLPIVADVALSARTPVLAVPVAATAPIDLHGKAVIAWNGSPEGATAVRASLPLLKLASSVVVLTIDGDDSSYPSQAAIDYLALHGVTAHHRNAVSNSDGIGAALIDTIDALDAAYVVMGAYGHSRFREALLGGVTRSMLAHSPVPLLLAH
jgi:nucleotide-binding universal stress UspA family protein